MTTPKELHKKIEQQIFAVAPHDRTCLSFWYPQIVRAVPTPKTFFVRVSDGWALANLCEGQPCWYFDALCTMLQGAIELVGIPCFLRTGMGSGKHNWKNCCYLDDPAKLKQHIFNLVEWSHLVDFMGLDHSVWVVREMLPTKPKFLCQRYGDMPVVREWRYFVDGDKLLYGIPYWPEDALEEGQPNDENWRVCLSYLHEEPGPEVVELATKAGGCVGGKWSVDVLEGQDQWYVTDMAIAEVSYGWNMKPNESRGKS